MAPRVKLFKSGSIIYFKGDKSDSVFLVKSGRVVLEYNDIETDEPRQDIINTGEFFGVKSGLVRFEREENASASQDSVIVEFFTSDFEALITKNTSIILKMLKVFSNQLRKIGKQVQNLVTDQVSSDNRSDFFNIGEYYLKNKRYSQAISVYKRFLDYYPDDFRKSAIASRVAMAQKCLKNYGDEGGPAIHLDALVPVDQNVQDEYQLKKHLEAEELYKKGEEVLREKKFDEALKIFNDVIAIGDPECSISASVSIGQCYFDSSRFQECIKHLISVVKTNHDFPECRDCLFLIGSSYSELGDNNSAKQFLKKIITTSPEKDTLYIKSVFMFKEL